ncbi:SlyX family protein [Bradyrhizobium sp. dw_78]|uniref:SlyX family protein n=1 Tax=Bradyrhizobium sp. dw_78 TaxID=2719793 RepID=UPI001BD69B3E|nr:SlyX family protein [Bradyrhizobium sp. dw_78]
MNKTNDLKTLGDRLDAVESHLMHQDKTIESLNQTITDQWLRIEALARQIANLSERVEETEASAPAPANERPPHY